MPPAEIQRLRDRTRLRKALAGERTSWAQRLHALLAHEGWPCSRGRLLTREGSRWVAALELDAPVRAQVDVIVAVMAALEQQLDRNRLLTKFCGGGDRFEPAGPRVNQWWARRRADVEVELCSVWFGRTPCPGSPTNGRKPAPRAKSGRFATPPRHPKSCLFQVFEGRPPPPDAVRAGDAGRRRDR